MLWDWVFSRDVLRYLLNLQVYGFLKDSLPLISLKHEVSPQFV